MRTGADGVTQGYRSDVTFPFQTTTGAVPTLAVYVRERYFNDRDIWSGTPIDPNQEWYQLSDRAISCEVSEDIESFSSSFTVTFENHDGFLAPENFTDKWPRPNQVGRHGLSGEEGITYARQLYTNNQMRIYLGYGSVMLPYMHGWITETKLNADEGTISVSCNTSYKLLIHQTIKEKSIKAPTGNLYDVLKFFFEKAGVKLNGKKMYVPGTDGEQEWTVKGAKGTRGQSYDEVVRELIDTTFHYIKPEFDGSCTLMEVPNVHRDHPADIVFDESVNMIALDYTITDQDVSCAVEIKSGKFSNIFHWEYLREKVLLEKYRAETVDVPWADTYMKRKAAACAIIYEQFHKWRTISIGVVGDPRLELWDNVGLRERQSSLTDVWHIKGIQTNIGGDSGFFQTLELAMNYKIDLKYPPDVPLDLPSINVNVNKVRLKIWDWFNEDGDRVNIYVNDKKVASNYMLRKTPSYVEFSLDLGYNEVVFEGITCSYQGQLTGKLQVLDTNNNVLYDVGSIPDLTFKRINVDKTGAFVKRPTKIWAINRQN
jgi:hypothetical protein